MFQGLTGWHALILLVIIVLIFGATKLPALAKSVGQSMKIFKNEVKSEEPARSDGPKASDGTADSTAESTTTDSKTK